jgi:glutamate synthase (NADPH/NADH) small chain
MHRFNREPIEIGRLQRFAMDAFYNAGAQLPVTAAPPSKPLKVACIGAGPSSLACAAELARRGHSVTIYEARPVAGGLNTYGIAEYKLHAAESVREVEFIRSLGVEIRCSEQIDTARLKQFATEYDAVFLGLGLGRMESLGIPGEGLSGVVDALRLIADYKTAQTIRVAPRVAIVGAGNTAIDAANAAMRLGAERAIIVYRRTQKEMPAFAYEYEHAKQEGVDFCWSTKPVRIAGKNGRVTGIECVRVKPNLETIPNSEFTIACDMVIPAIGQSKALSLVSAIPEIGISKGLVVVDRATGRTGHPRFYAGGDIVNGGREVVDAVADGKRAALAIAAQSEAAHA